MKQNPASALLLLLFALAAAMSSAFAQSLPASMAYTSPILALNMPVDGSQNLLVAGNSLAQDHRTGFDLSEIPPAPESVVRHPRVPATTSQTDDAKASASTSKLRRSGVLLGVLAIAYLATRKRRHPQVKADASEPRDLEKKRLAQHEARA